jgi:hypothetical protein
MLVDYFYLVTYIVLNHKKQSLTLYEYYSNDSNKQHVEVTLQHQIHQQLFFQVLHHLEKKYTLSIISSLFVLSIIFNVKNLVKSIEIFSISLLLFLISSSLKNGKPN